MLGVTETVDEFFPQMNVFKVKYEECNAKAAAVLISSCCYKTSNFIDLHFFKVSEALQALDMFLDHHISRLYASKRPKNLLYIITGRGASNPDRVSYLQPPIKNRLKRRNIELLVFCVIFNFFLFGTLSLVCFRRRAFRFILEREKCTPKFSTKTFF